MSKTRIRAVVSTILLLAGLYIAVTGCLLHFSHSGLVLGIPRGLIKGSHGVCALVMTGAAAVHFFLNLRTYAREMRALRPLIKNASAGKDKPDE